MRFLTQATAAVVSEVSTSGAYAYIQWGVSILLTAAAGVIGLLWRLDRSQLVDRLKEATIEAEKNEVRYEQATKKFDAAVAELAAAHATIARHEGRREALSFPPVRPPPSQRS